MLVHLDYAWHLIVRACQECSPRAAKRIHLVVTSSARGTSEPITIAMDIETAVQIHKRLGTMLNAFATPKQRSKAQA